MKFQDDISNIHTYIHTYIHISLMKVFLSITKTHLSYIAILHCCKNGNFHPNNVIFFLFFAQNIDRGYTLEPPH